MFFTNFCLEREGNRPPHSSFGLPRQYFAILTRIFQYMRRRSPIEVTPSYKILLINMPPHIDRDDLNIVLARQNFHPVDIRVIRKNVAGDVRVFGFIDFADAQLAKEWFDYNQVSL